MLCLPDSRMMRAASLRRCCPERSARGAEKNVHAHYCAMSTAVENRILNMFLLVVVRIADPCQDRVWRQKLPSKPVWWVCSKACAKKNGSPCGDPFLNARGVAFIR
jgi:hypothetical protein